MHDSERQAVPTTGRHGHVTHAMERRAPAIVAREAFAELAHRAPAPFEDHPVLGSHPVAVRAPTDDEGGPTPPGPRPPRPPVPPPPTVSAPDVAIEVTPCLPAQVRSSVLAAIAQAFGPGTDVRSVCQTSERIGIWLRPSTDQATSDARDRGVANISLLQSGDTFAFWINASLIRARTATAWAAAPKVLDGDGLPDPDGPLHLNGYTLSFQAPDRVVMKVTGYDERPWPDVDFTYTITDVLSVTGGRVQCATSTDLDVDTSVLNWLTGIFLVVLPPLGLVFLTERIIIAFVDSPARGAGPGCQAAALIPAEILIPPTPLGGKVIPNYGRMAVNAGGITAAGTYLLAPRVPVATIVGPAQLYADVQAAQVPATFTVVTDDLRGALTISWSVSSGVVVNQGQASTAVRFTTGGASAGQVLNRQVFALVTDMDGLQAQDAKAVQIWMTDLQDEGIPAICRVKPWLPQCMGP